MTGTGGDEAAIFAADIFHMYEKYAALQGWRFERLDISHESSHNCIAYKVGCAQAAVALTLTLLNLRRRPLR